MSIKKTILVVEDNEEIRDSIRIILSMEGYDVLDADNGINGWDRLKDNIPDLILSDITMPVMNGIELYKLIKKDQKLKHIPFVFISSLEKSNYLISDAELCVHDYSYLQKPFSRQQLIDCVNQHVHDPS